jgi:hypothetical protein
MKKWILVALVLAPMGTFAGNNHPMGGCGLLYWAGLRSNETGPQIVASIFNNFFGSQTLGITSGASANFKELQREIAVGNGEFLVGFADILGVHPENRAGLFQVMQEKYTALFPSADSTSLDMLNALKNELAQRPDLLA